MKAKSLTLAAVKRIINEVWENETPTGDQFLDDRYEEQRKFAGGNTLPYYRMFYQIAEKFKPNLTVELGSFQATGASHFAGGHPEGDVVTIDKHTDPGQELDEQRCKEAERYLDNLHHVKGWTWDDHVVDIVKAFDTPIDIWFCDAWHRRDYVEKEWRAYESLFANKALLIFDDVMNNGGLFEGMEEWWDDLPYEKHLDNRPHRGVPMGFAIYKRDKK